MDTMISVWTVVEHVRVASGAAELAIFTAILYWFFTSSRVADMLEVVGERVGGWCGRDAASLRQAVRPRRRNHNDVYSKLDAEIASRTSALYRVKEGPVVPAPQPPSRPPAGLACSRCAPLSRESWHDPKAVESGSVLNILDIGRQTFANGGVVSRYLCDLAQCFHLVKYDYTDVVPSVVNDERFQRAIEDTTQEELRKANGDLQSPDGSDSSRYAEVRRRVEARAMKVLMDISSAMSNNVLRLVAWLCHKAIRRIAGGGCSTRSECVERLRRAKAAGLPLVFVPLHRSHFDYILVTFTLYLTGLRPPLVAAGDNMRIPFFGWILRGCGAFYIRRRVDGSEYHGDPVYKSALRAYILNSLGANNNLEFFIEGGRTRTGKPQPPKAGILSVIMDAYLDGTIDDALLVPVTLNYERLVDGSFVREQLGMPKQMETFWSALRGIWRTLNTDHGGIRVDFNQPISLKELVTSFQKYKYLKAPVERCLSPPNNNLAVNLDKQILYNHSHSSLYGADVSTDHKMMVEAIGRHLVYDAAASTALMSTNVVAYVLLSEQRGGCSLAKLRSCVEGRGRALVGDGRDLGYSGDAAAAVAHALDMLGRGLVRRDSRQVRAQTTIAASLELSYYANALVAHYAAPAILATALESIVCSQSPEDETIRHSDLLESSLQLCEILSQEFIICPPCHRIEETMLEAINTLLAEDVISQVEINEGLEEQRWSRRFAQTLEDDEEERPDPTRFIKYRISKTTEAIAERRRLLLTIRPLLEAYAATCRRLVGGSQKHLVTTILDSLTEEFTQNRMLYDAAASHAVHIFIVVPLLLFGINSLFLLKLDMLGRGLVRRDSRQVRAQTTIAASLELSYYANALVAHYAAPAILATALESIVCSQSPEDDTIRHSDLLESSLQLCEILSQEFIICPPCHRIEETMLEAINTLLAEDVISQVEINEGLDEQRWSRRFAQTLEDDEEERPDPTRFVKYRISKTTEAIAERRRLLLTIRPLLEAYAATCRRLVGGSQKHLVTTILDSLTEEFTQNRMPYGEAVSTDAIRNCLKLMRQWGVVEMYTEDRERRIRLIPPYDNERSLEDVCTNVYKFNMDSPILNSK